MRPAFINYNGEIVAAGSKLLEISNRGFRYGDGLFESMRMMRGRLKFAELHSERLEKGMKALHIEGYSQMDSYFLQEKVEELAIRNKIKHGRLRLTVYRDAEGLYTPTQNKMGYCIEIEPLEEPRYFMNAKGLIMDKYDEMTKPVNFLSNLKTCNSLLFVMASIYKVQNKLDEAFIINQHGFLCEAIGSNVFVLYQGTLYTPALSEGCISGVMRQVIMNLAQENNIPMVEAQIDPEILNQAEEVFLTNASRGIQWVMGFNKKRYFNETSKLLSEALNNLVLV
jgi:branched-subunit amino acid aminotransferase/4-amino-4-deoxychorismate lyase